MKKICFILTVFVGVAMAEETSPQIKIYLPRDIEVQSGALTLGEICIIRCEDEKILHKASDVAMGRGPFFKESLSLSRSTIPGPTRRARASTPRGWFSPGLQPLPWNPRTRLWHRPTGPGGAGIPDPEEALPEDRVWRLLHQPVAVTVADSHGVELKPRLAARQDILPDQARVEVALCRQDKELAVAELVFRADYLVQQAVAVKDIPARAKLTEEHFKVQIVAEENKPSGEWTSPLGMEATQAIGKGKVIGPGQVGMPTLEIIVRRDQKVKMMVEGLGFRISGIGQALDNGRPGDVIRVLNMDSQQTVACRVAADGTVHPLYDEVKKWRTLTWLALAAALTTFGRGASGGLDLGEVQARGQAAARRRHRPGRGRHAHHHHFGKQRHHQPDRAENRQEYRPDGLPQRRRDRVQEE